MLLCYVPIGMQILIPQMDLQLPLQVVKWLEEHTCNWTPEPLHEWQHVLNRIG